jgi:hypothetical protein
MSKLDWRSPDAYKSMQKAEAPDFAWECLRRNKDYQSEYRALRSDPTVVPVQFRSRWGLSFRS